MTEVFAHRGASAAHRENTVNAFAAARGMGADGVELDVRRSRDGEVVVHHDAAYADGRLVVETAGADRPPEVPLLHEAVAACGGMKVNIEIKNAPVDPDHDPSERLAEQVVEFIDDAGVRDTVIVSSFSLATITRVAALQADIRRGFLIPPNRDQHEALERAVAGGHHAIHPHHLAVNRELVEAAHGMGLDVNTWTVDDPDRMRWLAELGVDVIITNVPDVAIRTLRPSS